MKDIKDCSEKKKDQTLIIDTLLSEYEKGLILINRTITKLDDTTNYISGLYNDEDDEKTPSESVSSHGYFQFEELNNKLFTLNDRLEKIISRFYK